MTVVNVSEVWSGRVGDVNDQFVREYVRAFLVETDDWKDGPIGPMTAAGVPKYFSTYEDQSGNTDNDARLVRIAPRHDQDEPSLWQLTCFYTSQCANPAYFSSAGWPAPGQVGGADAAGGTPLKPTLRPPSISIRGVNYFTATHKDHDDKDIVNAAGDFFLPPQEWEEPRCVLTIKENLLTFSTGLIKNYQTRVNYDKFFGFAPRTVLCKEIGADFVFDGEAYWAVTYVFEINLFRKWHPFKILNAGLRVKDAAGKYHRLYDDVGVPITEPVPLQKDGTAAVGAKFANYLEFKRYKVKPFAPLNLEPRLTAAVKSLFIAA